MAGEREQQGGRPPESWRGRARALSFLGAALLAAVGVAVLLTRYMDTRIAAVRVPTVKVVVAATDLGMATTLRGELLAQVDWPTASRPDGAVQDPAALQGKVINAAIAKGEPVLLSKIASGEPGKSALATVLPAGMRAVSVHVDDVVGVAGFIHPGDHVDVIVTMAPMETSGVRLPPTSKMILQNIKVLAVGKELESRKRDPQAPVSATVATLMVDSEQAERLALAASKGQLLLALRSSIDSELVATSGVEPLALLAGTAAAAQRVERVERERPRPAPARARKLAARPPPAPAAQPKKVVEILRGDLFEQRDFHKDANP